jgi:hypothetical protein
VKSESLDHIAAGSWIQANFDVWIGFDEDNKAWEQLLKARQALDSQTSDSIPREDYELAREEIMIAEGSDWCWWYGPHHDCDNRQEFDQLYRDHLANAYRALRITPPAELSKPILHTRASAFHLRPAGSLHARIDGEVSSYFEWMGSGVYRMENRGGSMHGHRFLVKELMYGSNEERLYLRVDFLEKEVTALNGMEVRIHVNSHHIRIQLGDPALVLEGDDLGVQAAFRSILEVAIPFANLGLASEEEAGIEVSVWQAGLPMDSLPHEGRLAISPNVLTE